MNKERFEEAKLKHPIQLGLNNREEILYHGFKFVKQNDDYDIVRINKGENQPSIRKNYDMLVLFKYKPFTYVCDLYYSHEQTKRLLRMELNSIEEELSVNSKNDMIEIKKRLRKSMNSFF